MGLSDCRVQAMLAVSDLDRARRFYGTERVMEPEQIFYVPPGHDSWVVGDEPYVSLHIMGSEGYAVSEPAT
jgi:hypothetical protein